MKLIVDSGSTTTDWCIVSGSNIQTVQTNGLNPFFTTQVKVEKEIRNQSLLRNHHDKIREIYFYGAGCGTEKNDALIRSALHRIFSKADLWVYTDLLGAARGLFQNEQGIVCILGTGSNSGYYNGEEITEKIPSLGYILGDEGSGNHFGKELLKSYFFRKLPDDLLKQFREKYVSESGGLLQQLYAAKYPNIHLSGYTDFIIEHQSHSYIKKMAGKIFEEFIKMLKSYYSTEQLQKSIRFTGSVSWYLKDILQSTGAKQNILIDKTERSPMAGLIEFHETKKMKY